MTGTKAACLKWLVDAPEGLYDVAEHKEKRSLSQNAYYWALLGKLAGALRTSKTELHDELLQRYGQAATDSEGNHIVVTVRENVNLKGHGHFFFYDTDRKGNALYIMLKGSHEMDSREMSILLDGLISECHEAEVETMTPAEVARLKGYVQRSSR